MEILPEKCEGRAIRIAQLMINNVSVLLFKITASLIAIQSALAAIPSAQFVVVPICPEAPVVQVQADVRNYIRDMANCSGVSVSEALFIAGHESQFGFRSGKYDPAIKGPEKVGASYGIWQFYNQNEGFVKKCAIDLECSTKLAMQWLQNGRDNEWSTWANRAKWFADEGL